MGWIADLRFALRRLRRAPGFSAATVTMLALGIGLSVAMFSLLRFVLLERLPYPESARLVSVATENPREGNERGQLTPAEATDLVRAGERSPFASFAHYNFGGLTLFDESHPRELSISIVGGTFFDTLAMAPMYGRVFDPEEHAGKFTAVVLSYTEFQRVFGGRPEAVGQSIDTSEGRLRVVGVMPPGFAFPADYIGAWLPGKAFDPAQPYYPHARFVFGVARLRAGADGDADRQARLDTLFTATREAQHLPDRGRHFVVRGLLDEMVGSVRGPIWGAFSIALLVLLIACANVAILFDARQVEREHELALAHALGASAARIRRTMALELAALAGAGVLLGVALARLGLEALRVLAEGSVPRIAAIGIDPGVLGFAVALGAATPLVTALAGALRRRASLGQVLRSGARSMVSAQRTRRLVPALALALSTVSLIAAAGLGLSMFRLARVEPGFQTENLRALQFFRAGSGEDAPQFAEQLRARLAAVPGVTDVALTSAAPRSENGTFSIDMVVRGRTQPEPFPVALRRVDSGYLRLLGIPLLSGRAISDDDRAEGERVAVINRTLARRAFPDGDPVGQTVLLPLGSGDRLPFRVVGVMEDIRNDGLRASPAPELLIAQAQRPWPNVTFLVRTAGPIAAIDRQLAEQLWALDPRQAIARQFSLDEDLLAELRTLRFFSYTVGAFALLAQLLGAFGIYAVATLQQRRRMREFGLRLAVGARPAALGRTVLREGLVLVVAGASLGVLGALGVLRLLAEATYGLDGGLHWVMLAGAGAMTASALAALMIPAWRAARTDPMVALRLD